MTKEFHSLNEIQKYYYEKSNTYVFKQNGKYISQCNFGDGQKYLGCYDTPQEAFEVYKEYKEKYIKEVIDSYEGIIPEPHYSRLREAMYNYRVEIND